ncbi:MAG: peptide chain release factor N(5)-glutamine methyltransferase [Candidatus Limivivens sp.]|nr:peptide chain release factor N(5)-glutamine methyltransferase [Candidatus Limivivens sp.]
MTYRQALKQGEALLEEKQVPDAGTDAWYLLEYTLKSAGEKRADRTWYFLHESEEIPKERLTAYQELLEQRGRRIPLQHLTGEQEFMGIPFLVNEQVLIPRQDTETLVEESLRILRPGMEVLDVCTGSGCIIISLAKLKEGIAASASDLSEEALETARENDRRQQTGVRFFRGDLFEAVEGTYDVIVSNPPYIPTQTIETLMEEVRLYEPRLALDGREDGLYFYRRLAAESRNYLKPGGHLLLEIGADQGEDVKNLLKQAGFCNVSVKKDLAGRDRVAAGERPTAGGKKDV